MQAYAEMFQAIGDERYLDKLSDHVESVLRNRDDFRWQVDWKGDLAPAWGTDRYTKEGDWKHFAAHTGMITYPIEIWKLSHDLLFEIYRVDLTAKYFQEDWWGTVMLGIARLANNAKYIKVGGGSQR